MKQYTIQKKGRDKTKVLIDFNNIFDYGILPNTYYHYLTNLQQKQKLQQVYVLNLGRL